METLTQSELLEILKQQQQQLESIKIKQENKRKSDRKAYEKRKVQRQLISNKRKELKALIKVEDDELDDMIEYLKKFKTDKIDQCGEMSFIKNIQDKQIFNYWVNNEFHNNNYRVKTLKNIEKFNKEQHKYKNKQNEKHKEQIKIIKLKKELEEAENKRKFAINEVEKLKDEDNIVISMNIESELTKLEQQSVLKENIFNRVPDLKSRINSYRNNSYMEMKKEELLDIYRDIIICLDNDVGNLLNITNNNIDNNNNKSNPLNDLLNEFDNNDEEYEKLNNIKSEAHNLCKNNTQFIKFEECSTIEDYKNFINNINNYVELDSEDNSEDSEDVE